MNYQQTLEYLYIQTPMFQKQGAGAYKPGLANTIELDNHYGNPHKYYKTIHVGGTNGKGSVAHSLAAILQTAGYKVGLYTSPHLLDFSERIRISGEQIDHQYIVDFIEKAKPLIESMSLSFFELTTIMAFKYFKDMQVDIAIIEVGLGGRLDCTNIITPELSVITNISFDHIQQLGNTLPLIANEKAGIIKTNIPVVVGEATPDIRTIFNSKTTLDIVYAQDNQTSDIEFELKGLCQNINKKTILASAEILKHKFNISQNNIEAGMQNITKLTGLMGRWQVLQYYPTIVADTAHNKAGIKYIVEQLASAKYEKLRIVIGVVNDKDISSILALLPKHAIYYFTNANIHRALKADELQQKASEYGLKGNVYDSVREAVLSAKGDSNINDFVFVGGSNFTVAEALPLFIQI